MAEAAGSIFGPINAETGDTSQFTSVVVEGSNTFAASTDADSHGTYGFRFTGAQKEGGRGIKTFTEVGDGYYRFYMRIPTDWSTVDTGVTYAKIFQLMDGSTEIASIQIRCDPSNGNIRPYRFYYRTNDTTLNNITVSNSGTDIDDGSWHYWEVRYLSNNGGGVAQCWFDGSSVAAATSIATSNYLADSAEMGTQNADNATWDTGSVLDYDDFIGDTSAIGAYEDSGVALAASPLSLAEVVFQSPSISQVHAFTASSLALAEVVFESPTISQVHALEAGPLVLGEAEPGEPALHLHVAMSAAGLTTGPPVFDEPSLSQVHALSASSVSSPAVVFDSPAIVQVHAETAESLSLPAAGIDEPSLSTEGIDALTASPLSADAVVLQSPALAQVHALTASSLTLAEVALDEPTLTLDTQDALDKEDLSGGTPGIDEPSIGQVHALTASPLSVSVSFGDPALGQHHRLSEGNLVAPEIVFDEPGQIYVVKTLAATATVETAKTGTSTVGTKKPGTSRVASKFAATSSFK